MILIDTNVVSEAMKPVPDDAVRGWLDEQAAETLYLSSVTIAELMFGIGAHRSILSHSILMGAALEAGLLSLLGLVQLVHGKLPALHDPLWDSIHRQATSITLAASRGASIGMAYHLLVDGLVQPAPYHDLPVSLPMAAHQTVFVVNAAGEAADVRRKPSPS